METTTLDKKFSYSLPTDWEVLSPDRSDVDAVRTKTIERLKEAGIEFNKTDFRKLETSFGQLRNYLQTYGISSLGIYAGFTSDEENSNDEVELVSAVCGVANLNKQSLSTELPLRPEMLAAVFSMKRKPEDVTQTKADFSEVEKPEIIELPVGKVLVTKNILSYKKSLAEVMKLYTQAYYIPHDEKYDSMTMVQFSTPSLGQAKKLSDLFRQIALKFQFVDGSSN